ncbi:Uncharacterised protein [Vibrio cholerae]|nr:Uncharacterised protein [Vibrio cholerae]
MFVGIGHMAELDHDFAWVTISGSIKACDSEDRSGN